MIVETKSGSVYDVDTHGKRVRLIATWGDAKPEAHRYEWARYDDAFIQVGRPALFSCAAGTEAEWNMRTSPVVDTRCPVGGYELFPRRRPVAVGMA